MEFMSKDHVRFYQNHTIDTKNTDRMALAYVAGLSPTLREHYNDIFDERRGLIKPEALQASWQTGGTLKLTRLAFNLYTWNTAEGDDPEKYAPKALFSGLDEKKKRGALYALEYFT